MPLIYLHPIEKAVAGMRREDLEIIDGQQRINALFGFREGAFKLFDPVADDKEAKFPVFIKDQFCDWGRKDYNGLTEDLKRKFMATPLSVVRITTH